MSNLDLRLPAMLTIGASAGVVAAGMLLALRPLLKEAVSHSSIVSTSDRSGLPSLNEYFRRVRNALNETTQPSCTVLLGNASVDLDSVACSIAYAFALQAEADACPRFWESSSSSSPPHSSTLHALYIPVLNLPRADLPLRTEVMALFGRVGLDPALCICKDEAFALGVLPKVADDPSSPSIILVDHNELQPSLSFLDPNVVEIIDHHVDSGAHQHVQSERRRIEVTGSASSLVASHIGFHLDALFTQQTAMLLLGAILIDTVNLDPNTDRATTIDHTAVELLLPFVGMHSTESRRLLFEFVREQKFRCGHLSTSQLLRKDDKLWELRSADRFLRYGISSVLLPLEQLLAREEGLSDAVLDRMHALNLDICFVMCSFVREGAFERQLFFVVPQDSALKEVVLEGLLHSAEGESLELESISALTSKGEISAHAFRQLNTKATRKQVQPIIHALLQQYLSM